MEVRREEILSTTVELLDRLGLAATRVADVAVALDVSPALVFYHFGTKDDLVAEAFAHAVERDLHRLERAASGEDPVARLRRVLRLYGPTGRATGWLSALVDGLSVAAVVHRTVTREQLRSWVAAQLAVELGVDVATLD